MTAESTKLEIDTTIETQETNGTHAESSEGNIAVLEAQSDVRNKIHHVDPVEFCRLAVSNLRLERLDNMGPLMKGLKNRDTGEQYIVNALKLAKHEATAD